MTGVFESLERNEAADIIKEYGGKVTTSLSKKTTYIVLGEESGLAKIAKADELGTQRLSEDGLLDLIRTKSGLPSKEVKSESSPKKEKKSPTSNGTDSKSEVKKSPKKIKKESEIPKKEEVSSSVTSSSSGTSSPSAKKMKTEQKTPKKERPSSTASGTSVNKNAKFEKSEDIPIDRPLSEYQQNIASVENQAWVEKYKPTNIKQIIGQQGAASNVTK